MTAALLAQTLADPESVDRYRPADWEALISAARAEQLIGSLPFRLQGRPVPEKVESILAEAREDAEQKRRQALWEAEMARRALAPLAIPVILLKGTAYAASGLDAGVGRSIGDLDLLVPRSSLDDVQDALIAAGWEWVKEDAYDDLYYRRWMHELPPLIHRDRDRMADVHHTILPLTARPRPDPAAMIADSIVLNDGLRVLCPEDMIVHAATHLFADGDLGGGLRNLWDIDRLLREFGTVQGFWGRLFVRARLHQLAPPVARALRLAHRIYGTPVDRDLAARGRGSDGLFIRRLLARDGWGRPTRPALRFGFYVRGHSLRMPPAMLARHLWVKARKRPSESRQRAD